MCIICEQKDLTGIQILNCINCPLVIDIPHIQGLQRLYCKNCPLLTDIPNIQGLQYLRCINCPSLTSIPNIQGLQILNCVNCPLLTDINVQINHLRKTCPGSTGKLFSSRLSLFVIIRSP